MYINDKNKISDLIDTCLQLYTARDDRLLEHCTDDFTGFSCNQKFLIRSREEWLAASRGYYNKLSEHLCIDANKMSIQLITDKVAVVTVFFHTRNTVTEYISKSKSVRLALIVRKEFSNWKIAYCNTSMTSTDTKSPMDYSDEEIEERNYMLEQQIIEKNKQLSQIKAKLKFDNEKFAEVSLERKQAEEELRKSEAHFRMITESVSDVVWKLDDQYYFTYISPSDEKRRGYTADEVLGHHVFEMFDEEGIITIQRAAQQRHESERQGVPLTEVTFEARHRCKDGSWIWGEICYNTELDYQGNVIGFYGISREITLRKQMQDKVRELAFYDPLTKLPNRHLLNDRLIQAMAASKRNKCFGALMFLDLDNFKPINDLHGHIAGDLLLIEVAQRLKRCVREIDTIARFGGDEFIIIISELSTNEGHSCQQAQLIAEKIRVALAQIYQLKLKHDKTPPTCIEHSCTASIGVVLFSEQEISIDDLYAYADNAMYEAKKNGRNTIRFHNPNSVPIA